MLTCLKRYAFFDIGSMDIGEIETQHLTQPIKCIEDMNKDKSPVFIRLALGLNLHVFLCSSEWRFAVTELLGGTADDAAERRAEGA